MSRHQFAPPRVPSRHANPFATCWTRPGALAFQFSTGESAAGLVARLATTDWRGEIVGPHGSGKSTLLETLGPHLRAAERGVSAVALRDGQRRLPADFLRKALASSHPLVIVDGYEQLSWLHRRVLIARCRLRSRLACWSPRTDRRVCRCCFARSPICSWRTNWCPLSPRVFHPGSAPPTSPLAMPAMAAICASCSSHFTIATKRWRARGKRNCNQCNSWAANDRQPVD